MAQSSRYRCMRCGNCCRWPGYVRVTESEIDRIAEFLDMTPAELIEGYTVLTEDRRGLSFVEQPDGSCIFLEGRNTCVIEPVKPRQCVDFPERWQAGTWQARCQAEALDDERGSERPRRRPEEC